MKTSLDHLPERKQRELGEIRRILFEEFEDTIAGRNAPHRKAGRILKVILYGSHARGDWVEDPVGGYFSDYDVLVVVNHEELADPIEYWSKAEDHLLRAHTISKKLSVPAHIITHSLTDVNKQLKKGRPFFRDILRDGIALYEAPDNPFDQPVTLPPDEARAEAQKHFDKWFPSATAFFSMARHALSEGNENEAAFVLHQTTERLYDCFLLVSTLYAPKSHKINLLRSQCEQLDARLIQAWPRDTKFTQRCFELLRGAYVNARYSEHYKITAEELEWICERITILQGLVKDICQERLGS
ncbi:MULTISPECIES: HEPN domain-containing protein [Sphingobium]|uniref:Nucleotidyltransferase n=1 Tax=Sphingobium chungbukense TaxID=56193 RepID=A0A0M3AH60_9SPHN|nr:MULTISPECIES: HEPN domain-containing protein [Sphingobium]OAP30400.1 nucleotidyltransferase [Sphingobium sp. 20006FA]KKW89368.1 nucleotidyltransferase [Sphingobium chungbukense]KXU30854.1 nucleotidyltransferase [Sphingobium sp. AM]KYC30680.1 nucleotidyltransferase [Sphingobium sp. 22B]MCB4859020.1 HEPN domain-containing protein [Sphingobium sp. PNB]